MASTLGQRIRALRIERGLSQADLAGDMVSPSYVSLIESGRRSPEREVLEGLARRLGCSALYLESGVAPEEISERRLQLQFANIARANGDLGQAREAFATLTHAATGELRHEARWGLARTDEALGHLDAALTQLDALTEASRAGEPGAPGLLTLMTSKCRIYRRAGDFARSIEVGEAALTEIRALGLEGTEDAIRLASTLAFSYQARGDMFSAQRLARQVIEQAEQLDSRQAQANAYWSACTVAGGRGEVSLALDLAAKTLALLSESPLPRNLASMRINYAELLLRSDPPQLDEADAMLSRAYETLSEQAFAPLLAACQTQMAWSALLRGDVRLAAQLADQATAGCTGANTVELQNARVVSGLALVLSGEPAAGAERVGDAAAQLAELGAQPEAARAWRDLAEALIRHGDSAQAIRALQRAADSAGVPPSALRAAAPVPVSG